MHLWNLESFFCFGRCHAAALDETPECGIVEVVYMAFWVQREESVGRHWMLEEWGSEDIWGDEQSA